MKIKNIALAIFAASFVLVSCTKDFEELDRPQTTSDIIDPSPLFTRALVTGSGLSVGVWQWMHQISGSVYAQHFANIQVGANFTSDNYEPRAWDAVWNWYYAQSSFAPMHYTHHVINLSKGLQNPIREAIARIWMVYLVQQVTDMYGDIPVFEAFKVIKPAFDSQKDIYLHLLNELEQSVSTIKEFRNSGYPTFGQADVLFQGNLDSWIAFSNTMLMRLALRASNTAEFNSQIKPFLERMVVAETIGNHNQTAKIIPDPVGPTYHVKNPLIFVSAWHEVRLSKTIFDILWEHGDPRLQVFANPNAAGEYVGLPNGQPHSLLAELRDSHFRPNFCNIGDFFLDEYSPHFLVTYAESCFLKAEAAHRGYIAGSAQAFYNEGVTASFNQFGITDQTAISSYLSGNAQFNPAKALEQIWTQRWIALFPNGHEAWSLVRRTGFPQINQPVYTFPGNEQMPRRKQYPNAEMQSNNENYSAAVARMGGDSQYTRVWWDGGN